MRTTASTATTTFPSPAISRPPTRSQLLAILLLLGIAKAVAGSGDAGGSAARPRVGEQVQALVRHEQQEGCHRRLPTLRAVHFRGPRLHVRNGPDAVAQCLQATSSSPIYTLSAQASQWDAKVNTTQCGT
jgi:hypothetical protein